MSDIIITIYLRALYKRVYMENGNSHYTIHALNNVIASNVFINNNGGYCDNIFWRVNYP